MASMNYFNSSRNNITYILNGTWKEASNNLRLAPLLGVTPMQRMKNSEKLTPIYLVFSTGLYKRDPCITLTCIETKSSTFHGM